ncbi:MAG: type II toxin-antitoxin system VapC family toxin [Bacillota bacterium]|nr:type II toxin-antitoxin system VapC family toxin [Bacillota bacterium]
MKENIVIYWDTSAIISTLFKDTNTGAALKYANTPGLHLVSSLGVAETYAVINRMQREDHIPKHLFIEVITMFEEGPWRGLNIVPSNKNIKELAKKWPLRGADLWHLSTAKTLHEDLPELRILTFDHKLQEASVGEGLWKFRF